ncbi:hypothetical protein PRVXH_000014 [Proteinivorax hydrogeniformans]|uniref:DNA ligase (ATP) n=1 Tax=Proteinivorax hydrogeniformans TaxID=1826727 RepID=A0AAU8HT74_9FIRM
MPSKKKLLLAVTRRNLEKRKLVKMKQITPMEPVLKYDLINCNDSIYQVKWDGIRILTYKENKDIYLTTRKGKDKTNVFPEIQELKQLSSTFVLDGEAIIIEEGFNDFSKILTRNQLKNKHQINIAIKEQPITYMVFDIIYLNGKWLSNLPYSERYKILTQEIEIKNLNHTKVCKNYDDGESLFKGTKLQKLEGVLEKDLKSKYTFTKSKYWKKYKHTNDIDAFVGGIYIKNNTISSLALGTKENGFLRYIGNVGVGLDNENIKEILSLANSLVSLESPFKNKKIKKHIFLKPNIKVNVEFMQWTPHKTMRSPVFRGIKKENV